MSLQRIISGAQTGVDRAALDSAVSRLSYYWGGWVPKGRISEDGEVPERYFTDRPGYGLRETESSRYTQRTMLNVKDSDATLILRSGTRLTRGTKLTMKYLRQQKKPYRVYDPSKIYMVPKAARWICETRIKEGESERSIEVLNVAGPRESKFPGIYEQSRIFLTDVLSYVFTYQQWGSRIWAPHKTNST
jgi:hypothetical protein